MSNKNNIEFTILCDTREKIPWVFKENPTVISKVKYGDYTVRGLEHCFSIERKRSTGEFAGNMVESRFSNLLLNLSAMSHAYIICEFSFDDVLNYPLNSGIPKYKYKHIRVSPSWMVKYISDILIEYNIPVIFAGNNINATKIAYSIMKEAVLKCQ